MAKEDDQEKTLVSEKITRNIIVGKDGRQEISTDLIVRDYEDRDCDSTETIMEHPESGDCTVINAAEMFRPKAQGGVTLKRCDGCVEETQRFLTWLFRRNQAVNVYSPASTSRRCFTCRKSLCEKHYVLSDKHIRCRACDRHFRLKRFVIQKILRPMFFKRVR
jgi:hypothetical protein